mgnify:CR=1 FL=1
MHMHMHMHIVYGVGALTRRCPLRTVAVLTMAVRTVAVLTSH